MDNLDRLVAIAVRIAEREGLLYEDDRPGSISTPEGRAQQVPAAPTVVACHSPAIPFPNPGGTIRGEEGEDF